MWKAMNDSLFFLRPMNCWVALFFLIVTHEWVWAQNGPVAFGSVSQEELTMKEYSGDTSAVAVVLFDQGHANIFIGASVNITYRRHVRIKIFNKEAFEEWANVSLLVERGSFSRLRGVAYNLENGRVVETEINDDAVFRIKHNKYIDEIKFTLPNVMEGSVIEYSYMLKGDIGLPDWQFQYSIPVVWSEYTVGLPSGLRFNKTIKGVFPVTTHEVKNDTERWVMTNIPAFKPEPLMPNPTDYLSRIAFMFSTRSWWTINSRLLANDDFGGTITGFSFLKKDVSEITAGMTDPMQVVQAIHDYVRKNLEWNGTEDIYAEDLKTVFKNKKGTAADINLALASMLQKAGIQVEMVLLSTRGNGFTQPEFPTLRQFNYTICLAYLDTVQIFLDATEKYLPWNVLPERCQNGEGLVISDAMSRWVQVASEVKARTAVTADLILNDQGDLQGKLTYQWDGYAAYEKRSDIQKTGKEAYLQDLQKERSWKISDTEFQNLDENELDKPAGAVHEISVEHHSTLAGDYIYVDPFITFKEEENPFKADTRKFPIDFGVRSERIYISHIAIPDGYMVEEVPETKRMILPDNGGRFTYSVSQVGNRISVISNIQINNRVFLPDQYPHLRALFDRIVAKQAEPIVLKKKRL
jgi:hypothetical protein